MAAGSNSGFHGEDIGSAFSRHAISFQSSAINSLSEMVPMGNYFGLNNSSGMIYPGNSSIINSNPVISQANNSSGSSLLLDSVTGLKHDTGLAVEWSVEEQYRLEEGLAKYADEPSIMRYIKIAATLPDKTVRDVALRCRWMTRKRRKPEEHNVGKKVNNRKIYDVVCKDEVAFQMVLDGLRGFYCSRVKGLGGSPQNHTSCSSLCSLAEPRKRTGVVLGCAVSGPVGMWQPCWY
ncbi:uncharacterized protein G2W53_036119 [Senna tora]|uniref:Uncharacterized protein n=1 Tax=Senna tora TaxID=362788 RepID=A0A834W8E0_9FABA|nr:uncharacterized protein G2W53_036119 [Senna tora]